LQAYISESYDRRLRSNDFFLITFSQLPNFFWENDLTPSLGKENALMSMARPVER